MEVKVVSKDVGVGENDVKTPAIWKYSPTCLKTKLQERIMLGMRHWTQICY
jgi:hypothetical protein